MRLFAIPPGRPFLADLATGLLARAGSDPAALSRMLVLLPTRRAARALAEAFLRQSSGRALLLPRLLPIAASDADDLLIAGGLDLPAAVEPARRQGLLAHLVLAMTEAQAKPARPDHAWRLAGELTRLLDEIALEEVPSEAIGRIVPADLAQHWQSTLRFLEIVTRRWPECLAQDGMLDPSARRVALLDARSRAWAERPPDHPVIAAGFAGTIPAAARLLRTVARLPQGAVVLAGLDAGLDDAAFDQAAAEPTHPQAGLARLLHALDASRADVRPWPHAADAAGVPAERAALLSVAMRPAAAMTAWTLAEGPRWRQATAGLRLLEAADPNAAARGIAIALRAAIARPGATAALVTPDRRLAQRVAGELARFHVIADDSAGEPLGTTPAGTFLRLLAALPAERFAPVPLLALLKHPLSAFGRDPAATRAAARALERDALRGIRPPPGLDALRRRAPRSPLPDQLAEAAGQLAEPGPMAPAARLDAHLAAAERVATTPTEAGAMRLWAGEEGEALAGHLNDLASAFAALPDCDAAAYAALFEAALEGAMVRGRRALRGRPSGAAEHPRIAIWGLTEARLQHADLLVLAGLEETVWPAAADPGPWLSRAMRAAAGLPPPERLIGESAADFAALACSAPEVLLVRTARIEGTPMVPSRWLTRLDAFLRGQTGAGLPEARDLRHWATTLDDPDGPPAPIAPPAPVPPSGRPAILTQGDVASLMRDPYEFYAKRVLRLRPLRPLDQERGAADLGELLHRAIARLAGGASPESAVAAVLDEADLPHALAAFWRPRLRRAVAWAESEIARRARDGMAAAWTEIEGGAPCGPVRVEARADRIELWPDGLAVIDLKSGTVPTKKAVEAGTAPQLVVEALIASAGGFPGLPPRPVTRLEYWRASGGAIPGCVQPATSREPAALIAHAIPRLEALLARFNDPAEPFPARPHPDWAPDRSDYEHLARVQEWGG